MKTYSIYGSEVINKPKNLEKIENKNRIKNSIKTKLYNSAIMTMGFALIWYFVFVEM
jgi:hypothetical protein